MSEPKLGDDQRHGREHDLSVDSMAGRWCSQPVSVVPQCVVFVESFVMVIAGGNLPHVDEHSVAIGAAPLVVWDATLSIVEQSFASSPTAVVARALGCRDVHACGPRPLAVGSAFPGFHVVAADAPRELELAGCHRFSSYALIFRLDELVNGRVQLRAETRAEFPGVLGRIYRAMVIGTGGHVLGVKRLLAAAKRWAERAEGRPRRVGPALLARQEAVVRAAPACGDPAWRCHRHREHHGVTVSMAGDFSQGLSQHPCSSAVTFHAHHR